MTITPVPYHGAKTRVGASIAALLPRHEHYVEAFFGSGAVLFAKPRSRAETANDAHGRLVTFWRVLRDRPDELAVACELSPHARQEHADAQWTLTHTETCPGGCLAVYDPPARVEHTSWCELETARRVFVALTQTRGRQQGGWRYNIRAEAGSILPLKIGTHLSRLLPAAERIRDVSIENLDVFDLIGRYGGAPTVCMYLDPPYLIETRAYSGTAYDRELTTPEQHTELAKVLADAKCAVVVSGYRSALYDALYDGWYVEELPTVTQQGNKATATCEVLWSNRPLGDRVQPSLWD